MLTKDELLEQYEVLGFAAYMCMVKRRADGVKGTLDFTHVTEGDDKIVRYYYNFQEV